MTDAGDAPPNRPLALTMGEPGGIGPEILLKARDSAPALPPAYVIGDPTLFARVEMGPVVEIAAPAEATGAWPRGLPVLPLRLAAPVTPGRADPAHAPQVIAAIDRAVADCLSGAAAGMVTLPIHKASLYAAGFDAPGHTEYIARLCPDAPQPVMMLVTERGGGLRVVPLTVHIPLHRVSASLDATRIVAMAQITAKALRADFGVSAPRLALAGLNPHAGEDGRIGDEEQRILKPALDRLAQEGVAVSGPFPADTLFHEAARAAYDAVLCCYHDQALIPLKTLDFWGGVNVTLGLPLVRTSPDHGTALDRAGNGVARADSLIAAWRMAAAIAARRAAG